MPGRSSVPQGLDSFISRVINQLAISTSNAFLICILQVNALVMEHTGYRVANNMNACGIMTVLFLMVSLTMLNLFFLSRNYRVSRWIWLVIGFGLPNLSN